MRKVPNRGKRKMVTAEDQLSLDLETNYPEYVIKVGKITFGEKSKISEKDQKEIREKIKKETPEKSNKEVDRIIRQIKKELKEKIERQATHLSRAACALLNSGGGVIRAEIEAEDFSFENDGIGQEILKSLKRCIHYSEYLEYFDFKPEESSMLIFVKSWSSGNSTYPRLCSLNTGLYERDSSSAMIRDPMNALSFLRRKKAGVLEYSCTDGEPSPKKAFLQNSVLPSREVSMQEEALPEAAAQFFKRDQLTYGEILNQLAESPEIEFKAFPKDKGILEFVESKLPVYVSAFASAKGGLIIFGVDDSKKVCGHTQEVEPCQMEDEVQRTIHERPHFHFCTSRQNVTHESKIMPVYDTNQESHGFVLALRIKPFCCAVFSYPPDSWTVKNAVERIEASEWCKLMTEEDRDMSELTENFKREPSISHKPLLCKPVYSIKGINSLKHLQQSLFPANSDEIIYKPEKLCTELFSRYPKLENIMKKKMEKLRNSKGILIFSRSWAVDIGLLEAPDVACDILLIATNAFPRLYTISVSSAIAVSAYSKEVARILKQKLVNEGGYTGKVCVIPHVIELGANAEVERDSGLVRYPSTYKVSKNNLQELIRSLVIVLLKFKSPLSDQLGYEFFNLLTIEQYEILKTNLHKSKKLFIYGFPGSGKTILATEIIKRIKNVFHCNSEEVLYICENKPLCNSVSMQRICQAVTRAAFLEPFFPFSSCNLDPVKHIIIDEAQNFRSSKGDWYAKARDITKGNGVLWIFLDYLQTTHTFDCGLPDQCNQEPQEWLTIGVRNATQIYEDMLQLIKKILSEPTRLNIPYNQLKNLLEKVQCGHNLEGILSKPQIRDQEGIVTYIVSKCVSYLKKGYSGGNIAILCNTTNERDVYKPLLEEKMSRQMRKLRLNVAFTTLDKAKGNDIVINSIRRFSGLERYIVFGIFPRSVNWRFADNLLLCLVSRANLHCHLLYDD
ncbi:schlafen family member 9-like [Eublepharis macularius]|uniref:Schlafen family member 9-like n=1 Tax=Eublepharis macularius TaxID=481883 RepID=A0AA97KIQ0_EUBMA|nr:schlafen family member 9-like [Eublepharis macularius]